MAPSTLDCMENIEKVDVDPSVKRYIKDVKGVESVLELNPSWLPKVTPEIETYVDGQIYAAPFKFVLEWRWQDFLPDWSQPFLPPIVIHEDDSSDLVIVKEWEEDVEHLEDSLIWCFLGRVFYEFEILQLCNTNSEDDCGEKIEHCKCGLGCPDCYGKVNCGCPDCYTPEKKKKDLKEILFKSALEIPKISYENCQISQANEEKMETVKLNNLTIKIDYEEVKVIKRIHKDPPSSQRRTTMCFLDRSTAKARNRMSLPAKLPREPIAEATVAPPQQTKYFCKTCNANICNICFSNVCKGHNVQYLGSARFHCQSSSHVIQHQFSVFV